MMLEPVILPAWLREARDETLADEDDCRTHHNEDGARHVLGGPHGARAGGHDDIDLEAGEPAARSSKGIALPYGRAELEGDVFLALHPAQLAQRLTEHVRWWRRGARGPPGMQPIRYTFPACCADGGERRSEDGEGEDDD